MHRIADTIPAIVDRQRWYLVQRAMECWSWKIPDVIYIPWKLQPISELDQQFGKLYVLMAVHVVDLLTKYWKMKNMQCGNAFELWKGRLKIGGLKKMQILFLKYLHVVCQNHEHLHGNSISKLWYLVLLIKLLKSVLLWTKCYCLTADLWCLRDWIEYPSMSLK